MDAHTLIAFKFWHALMPERCDGNVMPSCNKLDAEVVYMAFFPTDGGWVELGEH
jgi:hypothetical protein